MARIAGVDLPRNKRGVIALTYIFGIGRSLASKVLAQAGVSEDTKVIDWNDENIKTISRIVNDEHKTEGQLNEYGFDIDYSNIIFVGGGATIMRRFAPDRDNVSYLEDVRLNARGYELLAKSQLNRS